MLKPRHCADIPTQADPQCQNTHVACESCPQTPANRHHVMNQPAQDAVLESSDLLLEALRHLTPHQLNQASLVSKAWGHRVSIRWSGLFREVWADKVCPVPAATSAYLSAGKVKLAVWSSLKLSQLCTLGTEEMTDGAWSFRFKKAAGKYWTQDDPYWRGGAAHTVKFNADSTVELHGGYDERGLTATWGLLDAAMHGKADAAEHGHDCVRIWLDGQVLPSYRVTRNANNWGFLLSSCWGLYTSWPMPRLGCGDEIPDNDITVDAQCDEVGAYNRKWAGSSSGSSSDATSSGSE